MNKRSPVAYTFLGVPGSGKTYFARNLAKETGAIRLSSDAIRLAIFGDRKKTTEIYNSGDREILNSYVSNALNYATGQILEQGHDVIQDAHHNKRSDRQAVQDVAEKHGAKIILVHIKTPHEVALQRGQDRDETEDQRKHSKEEMADVMKKHAAVMDQPDSSENVIEIDGTISFDEQYKSFNEQLGKLL
jgi:predicted kinase